MSKKVLYFYENLALHEIWLNYLDRHWIKEFQVILTIIQEEFYEITKTFSKVEMVKHLLIAHWRTEAYCHTVQIVFLLIWVEYNITMHK